MQGIIGKAWDYIPHPALNNHSTEIGESLLSACPAFCCRSLRKLFLPDLLRRSGFLWCALVMAALPWKVIVACSGLFDCQGTRAFNHRIGESSFRKVLPKSLQIFFAFSQIGIRKGGFIYSFLKFSKFHIYPRGEHRGWEMNFIEPIGRNGWFCMRVWGAESPSRCPTQKSRMDFERTQANLALQNRRIKSQI